MNPFDEDEHERRHFQSVVAAFKHYRTHSLQRVNKSETYLEQLPGSHQRRLQKYRKYLSRFRKCVDLNDTVLKLIIKDVEHMFENVSSSSIETAVNGYNDWLVKDDCVESNECCNVSKIVVKSNACNLDVDKVQSVLKQLVRDWSSAGAQERQQCYQPIIDEIIKQFPPDKCTTGDISVLVPGAGLGRLAWEVAARGYLCQGNEFSLFMLFASNFVLNRCTEVNKYMVFPWVHQYVNNMSCEHQLLEASFPDVPPTSLDHSANFSMAAGDFLKVYTNADEWNCVSTCFFIDCAPNVIAFIETIYRILKPGGVWINLGPLLYHYSDMPTEDSIEPPYNILCEIIEDVGFVFEKQEVGVKTKYAQNPNSMLQYEYDSVFFVCRKPAPNSEKDSNGDL